MTVRKPLFAVLAGFAALVAVPTRAGADNTGIVPAAPAARPEQKARVEQKLGAQVNLDLVFRDESERPITLREATQGKVTILVPVYFRCPVLCTKVLNGLLEALQKMPPDFTVGDKFTVVTVSMDPKEHADLGAAKKQAYLAEYGRLDPKNPYEPGWRFLTGQKESVAELLDTVGYYYEFDKAFKEYNHPSGIVILTPDGVVSRYFAGIGYEDFEPNQPRDEQGRLIKAPTWNNLRLALVDASGGKIGSLTDRLFLTCYRWDDTHQGYTLSVMRVVQVAGVLMLILMGTGITLALRWERRRAAALAAAGVPGYTENGKAEGTA